MFETVYDDIHDNQNSCNGLSIRELSVLSCPSLSVFQVFYIWIGKGCDNNFIENVLGCPDFASVPQKMVSALCVTFLEEVNKCPCTWDRTLKTDKARAPSKPAL